MDCSSNHGKSFSNIKYLRTISSFYVVFLIILSMVGFVFAICEDTDGGQDQFTNGFVQWNQYPGDPNIVNRNDYCTKQKTPVEVVNYCKNDGCGVVEFYCGNNNSDTSSSSIMEVFINCQIGCRDGACLTADATDENNTPQCYETDNGDDPNVKGKTYIGSNVKYDYCVGASNLVEYHCADNTIRDTRHYCEFGCEDGECKKRHDTGDENNTKPDDNTTIWEGFKTFNIDFGPYVKSPTKKTGPAAVGKCADFWNTVFAGGGLDSYDAIDMKYGDKTNSGIDGTFVNLAGAWGAISPVWDWKGYGVNPDTLDPMFNDYNYPYYNHGGESWVYLKQVPEGKYDVYVYGVSDTYDLIVDDKHYGEQTLPPNGKFLLESDWVEGHQYVKYSDVTVSRSGLLTIHLLLGSNQWHDTNINGLQIVPAGTPLNDQSGVNKDPCKGEQKQCKDDSDCPHIACICASNSITGCKCPVTKCVDGKCVTEIKKNNNSLSCELASTHEDMASVPGVFGPGPGVSGEIANDYKWSCNVNLQKSTKINSITINHNIPGEVWSTSSPKLTAGSVNPDPLVVSGNGRINTKYDDDLGYFGPGTVHLELFGQIGSVPFVGGKIIFDFDSEDDLIGEIPASSLGLERLDLSKLSCQDTDGDSFTTLGSVAYSSSDGVSHIFEDYCLDSQRVVEGVCAGQENRQIFTRIALCKYGCAGGVCLVTTYVNDTNTSDHDNAIISSTSIQENGQDGNSAVTDGLDTENFKVENTDIDAVVDAKPPVKKCDGCMMKDKCLSYGIRLVVESKAEFCDITGEFTSQKDESSKCDNNYECVSNYCGNGKCTDLVARMDKQESQLQKILSWLKDFFSFK